jgi:hypothetical protein
VDFQTYLTSKKIDPQMFGQAEPELWKTWSIEFEQMHPASFTAQKLYLINPIRRKYPLKVLPVNVEIRTDTQAQNQPAQVTSDSKPTPPSSPAKPSIPKPVFKPKPKMT